MRLNSRSIGTLFTLFLLLLGAGCRKTISPEVGRTGPPETWVSVGKDKSPAGDMAAHGWELDAKAVGTIVTLGPDFAAVIHKNQVFPVAQVTEIVGPPADTVPVGSRLSLKWRPARGPSGMMGASIAALRTGGEEDAPLSATGGARPDTGALTPGVKAITVQAPAHAGGGTVNLYFMVNFSPDTWWAGPDPSAWPISAGGERSVAVTDWSSFTTSPPWPPDGRAYFGPDSLRYLPSTRRPVGGDFTRRTFYEIYGDRIYARTEGDTVHMNSWVVFLNGGYDKDSKYVPRVEASDPAVPPGYAGDPVRYAVLNNLGLQGSPIGFRSTVPMKLTPDGMRSTPPQTSMYPDYRPTSVFRAPHLAGYWAMIRAGKAYALARAEDSDGGLDTKLFDPVVTTDRVDAGQGTPAEVLLRRKVLTFYVDQAPVLLVDDPQFMPKPGTQYPAGHPISFYLLAMDPDPFDPSQAGAPVGGPTEHAVLSIGFTLYGKNLAGRDTSITVPPTLATHPPDRASNVGVRAFLATSILDNFAGPDIYLSIRVCDCVSAATPGAGRCVDGGDPATPAVLNPQNVLTIHYVRSSPSR